jgi:cytochrome c556
MKDLGGSFKSVKDQLSSSSPNLALVRVAAQEVRSASVDLPTWFPAGSGPETGLEMRSFKEVWSDPAGFAKSAKEFETAAGALAQIVQGDDLAAARSQMESVGKTCGSCHDSYRSKKD